MRLGFRPSAKQTSYCTWANPEQDPVWTAVTALLCVCCGQCWSAWHVPARSQVGILSFGADLPATATQEEVIKVVRDFNANPDVHGILVQLPVSVAEDGAR
jgi:hypothetical protein